MLFWFDLIFFNFAVQTTSGSVLTRCIKHPIILLGIKTQVTFLVTRYWNSFSERDELLRLRELSKSKGPATFRVYWIKIDSINRGPWTSNMKLIYVEREQNKNWIPFYTSPASEVQTKFFFPSFQIPIWKKTKKKRFMN